MENQSKSDSETTVINGEKKIRVTADKRAYMREYMRKRYKENYEEEKQYKNSMRCKRLNELSSTDFEKYGKYLAQIHKLRKIRAILPPEMLLLALEEPIA